MRTPVCVRACKCVLGHAWADDDRKTGVHSSEVQIKVNSNSGVRQSLFAICGSGDSGTWWIRSPVGWEGQGPQEALGAPLFWAKELGGRRQVSS